MQVFVFILNPSFVDVALRVNCLMIGRVVEGVRIYGLTEPLQGQLLFMG